MNTPYTGTAKLPVGFDADFVRKYINSQYDTSKYYFTIPKELLQNSIDAGSTNTIIHIVDEKAIVCIDNGSGITPTVFHSGFVNLGGSEKCENAMGGFGTAKTSYLGNSAVIAIRSIAMVGNELVESSLYGSWRDYLDTGLHYQYGPVGTLDLSSLPVIVQNTTIDNTGTIAYFEPDSQLKADTYYFYKWANQTLKYSINLTKLTIVNNGDVGTSTSNFNTQPIHKVECDGYDLVIYQSPENFESSTLHVNVCNTGLYQAAQPEYLNGTAILPTYIIVDVISKVKPGERNYPWNSNREWVTAQTHTHIQNFINNTLYTSRKKQEANATEIALTTKALVLSAGRVIDLRQNSDMTWVNHEYANKLIAAISTTFDNINRVLKEEVMGLTKFGGIVTNSNAYGLSIDRGAYYSVYINPYALLNQYHHLDFSSMLTKATNQLIATLIHEFAHSTVRTHNESFSSTLTELVGSVPYADWHKESKKLEKQLLRIFSNNSTIFDQLEAYNSNSAVMNDSFKVTSIS